LLVGRRIDPVLISGFHAAIVGWSYPKKQWTIGVKITVFQTSKHT
jgi:hypothetical protein